MWVKYCQYIVKPHSIYLSNKRYVCMYIHHIDYSDIYPWKNLPKTNYSTDLSKKNLQFFCKVKNDIHRSNAANVTFRREGTKIKHVKTIDRWINLLIRICYITIFPKVRLFFVYISTGYKTPENMVNYSINVKSYDFTMHFMQQMPHHWRKQSPSSPQLL